MHVKKRVVKVVDRKRGAITRRGGYNEENVLFDTQGGGRKKVDHIKTRKIKIGAESIDDNRQFRGIAERF